MPRTKLSSTSTAAATAAASATALNDLSHPYPTPSTSPSLSPTLSPSTSPLPTLAVPLSLKTPNRQHVLDSTLSLPLGTTVTIPRKNGINRIGQSILGQLLSGHRSGRDHHTFSNDPTLSLQTIRPKEQQRRSVLPMSWTMGLSSAKSTALKGLPFTSPPQKPPPTHHSSGNTTPGATFSAPLNFMEDLDHDEDQPMLPSVWLEKALSGLSRTNSNVAPHYVTLPRVNWQDEQQQQQKRPVFPGLGLKSRSKSKPKLPKDGDKTIASTSKPTPTSSSSSTMQLRTKDDLAMPNSKDLSRRGSACELALGDDARGLFQQNRPKTLSSAVISSSIVPTRESLRNERQRSLDSSAYLKSVPKIPANLPASSTASCPPSTGTTTTTRGRFTIESSSALPIPFRTRTLSCSSSPPTPTTPLQQSTTTRKQSMQKNTIPTMPPENSTLPFSPPSSIPMSTARSTSSRSSIVSVPPSPSLSPSSPMISHMMHDAAYKSSHQRTHSNSSIHSSASTSSRRSQVIIPPPASASTFQFASFSSMVTSADGPGHQLNAQRRPNNIRNLSIQVTETNVNKKDSSTGHSHQSLQGESLRVHPLDMDVPANGPMTDPGMILVHQHQHQTMNRVHPHQEPIEIPRISSAPGYIRQRSLSATNLGSSSSASSSLPQRASHPNRQSCTRPEMNHHTHSWTERPTRRSDGSLTSGIVSHRHRDNEDPQETRFGSSVSLTRGTISPISSSSHGETSDVVMVKKSATGRMFTVERTIPASPTKCSRFTVVSSSDET
ncbi:hypothetical protein BGZ50_006080 [Haplosporangium sp. Z 11]|nr:hypothetical protein BGZ50_006080 [Haplosporangium sp. Z 11]